MGTKTCPGCKINKSLYDYYKDRSRKDGYENKCKKCRDKDKYEYKQEYIRSGRLKKVRQAYYSTEEGKRKRREYQKKKRESDNLFRMTCNLRSRTSIAFRSSYWHKKSGLKNLLGCNYKTAFKHIESQFRDGMSWDNYGEWHIDHIIPLCSATTVQELESLCHYKNLQPLWAEENISKGGSV
jgi:hypothetical protein